MAKIKSYNFWIKLISLVILLIRIVLTEFGFSIDTTVIVDMVTLVAGVMVLCGIIKDPTKTNKKENTIMYGNEKMKEDILNEINNLEQQGDAAASAALDKIKNLLLGENYDENGETVGDGKSENLTENNQASALTDETPKEVSVMETLEQNDQGTKVGAAEALVEEKAETLLMSDADNSQIAGACPKEVVIGGTDEVNETICAQNEDFEIGSDTAAEVAETGEMFINKCINNSEVLEPQEMFPGGDGEQLAAKTTYGSDNEEQSLVGGDNKTELVNENEINVDETKNIELGAENDGDSEARELLKEKVKAFLLNNLDELISSLG